MLYDCIRVLLSKRKHPNKDYYFYTHIQFTTNYLSREQKLKYTNYSGQQIGMSNFVQAK
jgi:hypothetical protein